MAGVFGKSQGGLAGAEGAAACVQIGVLGTIASLSSWHYVTS
jgi:hypothetical protein